MTFIIILAIEVVDIYLSQVDKMNELNHPFKEEFKKIAESSNNAIKETNKANS